MENTDEKNEIDALDTVVDDAFAQVDEVAEEGRQEPMTEENVPAEPENDDATMKMLKRFPRVCGRIAEIMREHAENVALELLSKGLGFDDAVANADKEGYLRGKNEKIELVKNHRMPQLDTDTAVEDNAEQRRSLFPQYSKKSIWE